MLDTIQAAMLKRATEFRESEHAHGREATTSSSRCSRARRLHPGALGGHRRGRGRIKEETKATIRCFPFDPPEGEGVCFYTGKRTDQVAIFARAY
jgi:prolyl-tRNA synthetase